MFQLKVTTQSGVTLLLGVQLTGQLDFFGGYAPPLRVVAAVEVTFFGDMCQLRGDGAKDLTVGGFHPMGLKILWVKPDDLCINGVPLKNEEILEEADRCKALLAEATANQFKLPADWP